MLRAFLSLSVVASIAACAHPPAASVLPAGELTPAPATTVGGAPAATPAAPGAFTPPSPTAASAPGALTPDRAVHFRRIGDLHFSPDGSLVACVVSESTDAGVEAHVWMGDLAHRTLRPFTSSAKSDRAPQWSPDGRSLAFLSTRAGDAQIYVMPRDGGEASALTSVEGGVDHYAWSPDSQRIAFLAPGPESKSNGPDAPHIADRPEDLARLWILDVATKKTRVLTGGRHRIDEITWPTADRIVVIASDDPRREAWDTAIDGVDVQGGTFTPIARPTPPYEMLTPSPRGDRFAYAGTPAAGPIAHDLWIGDAKSGSLADRSRTIDRAVREVHWQDDATVLVGLVDGFRYVLARLDVRTGKVAPLAMPLTVRAADVRRDGTVAFVGVSFDHLPELYVRTPSGAIERLGRVQDRAWDAIHLVVPETLHVRSFDGTDIESVLFRPPPTAPPAPASGKRPLVMLVHGGPSSAFTADYFWFNAWPQLLAMRGYEVLMVNPRGSTGYGEAFVEAIRGDWGGADYKDLMAALDAVTARGEVDPGRLGIGGWSYGGEMTAWAIGHTDRFRAAVFGAGVYDQAAEFETESDPSYDEWFFGTPWEHPEVFARTSPSTFIRNAHTPTLLIHGEADKSNPPAHSYGLYRALKHLGVEAQLVTYPGAPHGPQKASQQRDILERMLAWYDAHLLGEPAAR